MNLTFVDINGKYDIKSNEAFLVRRQLKMYENDLAIIREAIADEKARLHEYLTEKEKFYKQVRANRKKGQKW